MGMVAALMMEECGPDSRNGQRHSGEVPIRRLYRIGRTAITPMLTSPKCGIEE